MKRKIDRFEKGIKYEKRTKTKSIRFTFNAKTYISGLRTLVTADEKNVLPLLYYHFVKNVFITFKLCL